MVIDDGVDVGIAHQWGAVLVLGLARGGRRGSSRPSDGRRSANRHRRGCCRASSRLRAASIRGGRVRGAGPVRRWRGRHGTAGSSVQRPECGGPSTGRCPVDRPTAPAPPAGAAVGRCSAGKSSRWFGSASDGDGRTGPALVGLPGNGRPSVSQWARRPGSGRPPR